MEEDKPTKQELMALGVEIQTELISIGMDEVEIMNFWDECYKAAKNNSIKVFKDYEQN